MNGIENGVVARAHDSIYDNYWGKGGWDGEPVRCVGCGRVLNWDDRAFYEDSCEKCVLEQERKEVERESQDQQQ